MAPTIKEIAQDLGLSVGTVSGALNGHPAVRGATRKRVLETAKRLGYVPNRLARALTSNSHLAVGIVFGGPMDALSSPFYSTMVAGAMDRLSSLGRDVCLVPLPIPPLAERDEPRPPCPPEATRRLLSAVDGRLCGEVLIIRGIEPSLLELLRERDVPLVYAGIFPLPEWVPYVTVALDEASRMLCRVLRERAYRKVVYLGTRDAPAGTVWKELYTGMCAGAEEAGLAFRWLECSEQRPDPPDMRQSLVRLPLDGETALVCGNERMATLVTCLLQQTGRIVPRDVGVASFGNTHFATAVVPALSSVDFRFYEMGSRAAALLVSDDYREGVVERIEPQMILRESLR